MERRFSSFIKLVAFSVTIAQAGWTQSASTGQLSVTFDVASVRQHNPGAGEDGNDLQSNVPLGPGNVYTPTGGLLRSRNMPLLTYIAFAYKMTDGQLEAFRAMVPDWVAADRFDIEARTENQAVTKDQLRLMMRSLLAERFKLAVHYETREAPVFGLVLVKPGTTGPNLQAPLPGATCTGDPSAQTSTDAAKGSPSSETIAGGFPTICGGILGLQASASDRYSFGARDVPMSVIANALTSWGNLGRPVVDKTGLAGNYNFVLDFVPEHLQDSATGAGGPTFREALKQQLGLRLEPEKAPVQIVVFDHIEHATAN
jgi:uncharacterized protein (TIGR03435 family)